MGRPVNPTVVTTARWERRGCGEDPFLDEVTTAIATSRGLLTAVEKLVEHLGIFP